MPEPSTKPLRVLIVEDSSDDMLLMINELQKHQYDVTHIRVESAAQLRAALDDGEWDIILSDYSLPGFSGPAALNMVKERSIDAPFIVISGTVGEDAAVEAMKSGAADFFAKANLTRLGPAVERELSFAHERRQRKQAEIEIRSLKDRFEKVFHASPIAITITDAQDRFVDVNDRFVEFLGFSRSEVLGQSSAKLDLWVNPDDRDICSRLLRENGRVRDYETQFRAKSGMIHDGLISLETIDLDGERSIVSMVHDVTERKKAERELLISQTFIEQAQEVAHIGSWSSGLVPNGDILWSKEVYRIFGITEEEFDGKPSTFYSFVHPDDYQTVKAANDATMFDRAPYSIDHRIIQRSGEVRWLHEQAQIVCDTSGEPIQMIGVVQDITERKQAEIALRENEALQRILLENLPVGVWFIDINSHITYANPQGNRLWAGLASEESLARAEYKAWWPDGRVVHIEDWPSYRAVRTDEKILNNEFQIERADGVRRHILTSAVPLHNNEGEIIGALAVSQDISERKLVENELQALYNAVSFLYKADNLHTLGVQIVKAVVTEFGKIDCGLMLIDKTDGRLVRLSRAGNYQIDTEAPLYIDGPGLVPEAVRTESVIYSPDVLADTRYVSNHWETRSELVVPIKTGKGVIAVLDLQSGQVDAFSETDQRILMAFGERAAAAIENMQLYDEINRYAAELEWRVAVRTDQLRRVKERVEAILDNNGDAIILVRSDGLIAQTNPAFNEMFGYNHDEAIGNSLMELIEPEQSELLRNTLSQVVQLNKTMRVEITAVRLNHTTFAAEMALSSIAKDQTLGIVCSLRDISERKRSENRQHALTAGLRAVVTSASELIACEDSDTFFRRAVEIAREKLKLERCAIFVRRDDILCGTYGTSINGEIVDEHANCFSLESSPWSSRLPDLEQQEARWVKADEMRVTWDGVQIQPVGHGWTVSTPIPSSRGLVGMMFNDAAISNAPLDSVQQDVVAVFCSLLGNIMDRKGAEEALLQERNLLRTMIDNLPNQIYVKDKAGRFLLINYGGAVALGDKWPTDSIGKTDFDYYSPEVAAGFHADEQAVIETGLPLVNKEDLIVNTAGEKRFILSTKVPLRDNQDKIIGIVGLTHDITERKKMEEDLRAALKREKELSDLKSRFSSMVSHEFRTPLATIQSSNDLLKRYGDRMSEERKVEHIEEVEGQIRHLTGLLDDIMTISKAETVGLDFNPAPLDLEHYCEEMVEQFRLIAGKTRIAYKSANPCSQAVMDGRLVHRVLNNLLSNAIKYSPPESTVYFELACEAEYAIISVRDEGIGIPEADLDKLFEIFHRAKNVGDISGTGLGLAIVKRAIEVHGGSISVESELGVGTTFTVYLPLIAQKPETQTIGTVDKMIEPSQSD